MTTPKHTPTPWRIDDPQAHRPNIVCDRGWIASTEHGPDDGRANAALIVRAVNAHDAMIEALAGLLEHIPQPKDVRKDFSLMVRIEAAKTALRAAKVEA